MAEQEVLEALLPDVNRGAGDVDQTTEQTGKRALLRSFLPESVIAERGLEDQDIRIIALLLENRIDGREGLKAGEIMRSLKKEKIEALSEIPRFERLIRAGVIESDAGNENLSPMSIIGASFSLSPLFMKRLFTEASEPACHVEPYRENMEYLMDQFERVRFRQEMIGKAGIRTDKLFKSRDSQGDNLKKEVELRDRIARKLAMTETVFPFEAFKKKHDLNQKEELVVLNLLRKEFFQQGKIEVSDLVNLVSIGESPYEAFVSRQLFEENAKLMRKKIITKKLHFSMDDGLKIHLKLSDNVKACLLGEPKKRPKRPVSNIFEIHKPLDALDRMILRPETREELSVAIGMLDGRACERLTAWGLFPAGSGRRGKTKEQPLTMLFYGPPGTGKTLTAYAIAGELKRAVLTLDCSKILSKYVGESEQNVVDVFRAYDEEAQRMKRRPVLLLNEADQFLHRRIDAARSTDHMYNQMQNIFLEKSRTISRYPYRNDKSCGKS